MASDLIYFVVVVKVSWHVCCNGHMQGELDTHLSRLPGASTKHSSAADRILVGPSSLSSSSSMVSWTSSSLAFRHPCSFSLWVFHWQLQTLAFCCCYSPSLKTLHNLFCLSVCVQSSILMCKQIDNGME